MTEIFRRKWQHNTLKRATISPLHILFSSSLTLWEKEYTEHMWLRRCRLQKRRKGRLKNTYLDGNKIKYVSYLKCRSQQSRDQIPPTVLDNLRVRVPLQAQMYVCISLRCVVLCIRSSCDDLIPHVVSNQTDNMSHCSELPLNRNRCECGLNSSGSR
jgi:hypothetical protein